MVKIEIGDRHSSRRTPFFAVWMERGGLPWRDQICNRLQRSAPPRAKTKCSVTLQLSCSIMPLASIKASKAYQEKDVQSHDLGTKSGDDAGVPRRCLAVTRPIIITVVGKPSRFRAECSVMLVVN